MDPLKVVVILALIATVVTLFLGLLSMSGVESVDNDFSTPLMWTRVGLQAFAVIMLFVALFLH